MECENCKECKHGLEVCECCGDVVCKKCGERWAKELITSGYTTCEHFIADNTPYTGGTTINN